MHTNERANINTHMFTFFLVFLGLREAENDFQKKKTISRSQKHGRAIYPHFQIKTQEGTFPRQLKQTSHGRRTLGKQREGLYAGQVNQTRRTYPGVYRERGELRSKFSHNPMIICLIKQENKNRMDSNFKKKA